MTNRRYTSVEDETRRFLQAQSDLRKGVGDLAALADFCDAEFEAASCDQERFSAFQKTKQFAVRALGTLASQVNQSAMSVLGMLDLVDDNIDTVQAQVSIMGLQVETHREKVAKRVATEVCYQKRHKLINRKMKIPKRVQVPIYPGHKRLNVRLLDPVGCGADEKVTFVKHGRSSKSPMALSPRWDEESPYALTMRDIAIGGVTDQASSNSKQTVSRSRSCQGPSRIRQEEQGQDSQQQDRPQLEVPGGTSAIGGNRPRSVSLNDLEPMAATESGVADTHATGSEADIYSYIPFRRERGRQPASRQASVSERQPSASSQHVEASASTCSPRPSLSVSHNLDRERSKSLGCLDGNALYGNMPILARGQALSTNDLPSPPPDCAPLARPYIAFQPNNTDDTSQADTEYFDESEIQYETVLYETVVPDGRNAEPSHVSMEVRATPPPVPRSPSRSPALIISNSPVLDAPPVYYASPARSGAKKSTVPDWVPADYLGTAEAAYNFLPIDEGQLQLSQGEKIFILAKLASDPKWYIALNKHGERGIVPCRYVQFLFNNDEDIPEVEEPLIMNPIQI